METVTRYLGVLAASVLASLSLVTAFTEIRSLRLVALEDYENFTALQGGVPDPVWSIHGNKALLYACDDALRGRLSDLLPPSELTPIADGCLALAQHVLAMSPTWSVAHLVEANAAFRLGDASGSSGAIAQSQITAPFAGWLAERRLGLALRLPRSEQDVLAASLASDIETLLYSPGGRDVVVRFYVAEETLRPLIVATLEDAAGSIRRDFLARLRASQALGSGS
jgi:hypothetical protein